VLGDEEGWSEKGGLLVPWEEKFLWTLVIVAVKPLKVKLDLLRPTRRGRTSLRLVEFKIRPGRIRELLSALLEELADQRHTYANGGVELLSKRASFMSASGNPGIMP